MVAYTLRGQIIIAITVNLFYITANHVQFVTKLIVSADDYHKLNGWSIFSYKNKEAVL